MKAKTVAIEITSGWIDVAVLDGPRISEAERIPADLSADPADWVQGLRRLSDPVRAAVERLECVDAHAVVLYRSPTQGVDLSSLEVRSSSDALEAGRLACCDALPYSMLATVSESTLLGRDSKGKNKQVHVLSAAERDDVAMGIVDFVTRSGLKFHSATPTEASIMSLVSSSMLSRGRDRCGVLHIGTHSSFFVVGGGGTLNFTRRIGLGMEAIAQALTRPIRRQDGEQVELSITEARALLLERGIADRSAVVHDEYQLTGWQILPLIQPILQRSVVELRQSLRFGVSDEDREDLRIVVIGPGAQITGLTKMLSDELGVEMAPRSETEPFDWNQPGSPESELADAVRNRKLLDQLNVQPLTLARSRHMGTMRRWLVTGTVAALAVVGFDALRYGTQLNHLRNEADVLESQTADLEAMHLTAERLSGALTAMAGLERRIAEEVGSTVSYPGCLKELSLLTPDSIRFTSIVLGETNEGAGGTIDGFAGGDDDQALAEFVAVLRASPIIGEVILGNVQIGRLGDETIRRFTVTFEALEAPRELMTVTDASSEEVLP